jgi:hypothetical protein
MRPFFELRGNFFFRKAGDTKKTTQKDARDGAGYLGQRESQYVKGCLDQALLGRVEGMVWRPTEEHGCGEPVGRVRICKIRHFTLQTLCTLGKMVTLSTLAKDIPLNSWEDFMKFFFLPRGENKGGNTRGREIFFHESIIGTPGRHVPETRLPDLGAPLRQSFDYSSTSLLFFSQRLSCLWHVHGLGYTSLFWMHGRGRGFIIIMRGRRRRIVLV